MIYFCPRCIAVFPDLGLSPSEADDTILLNSSGGELQELDGQETEKIIKDISNNVQSDHISSSSSNTPPSSPESLAGHKQYENLYSCDVVPYIYPLPETPISPEDDVVSSTYPFPETPITQGGEWYWSQSYPSQTAPDSPHHYNFSCQWQQNVEFQEEDVNNNSYMPPSPDTNTRGYLHPEVAFDDKEENVYYEPWTEFRHSKPDGTCDCLQKRNVTKCLALKSKQHLLASNSITNPIIVIELRKCMVFQEFIYRNKGLVKPSITVLIWWIA